MKFFSGRPKRTFRLEEGGDFAADKEVRRHGIAFRERVAVAEPVIIPGIPALREIEQIVDVVLDDIPGVGELLVHRQSMRPRFIRAARHNSAVALYFMGPDPSLRSPRPS